MYIKTAVLTLTAFSLVGCDGMKKRDAVAAESSMTVTPPAPRVTTIELGKQAGADLRISEPATRFAARDTVYLAVVTTNALSDSRITARWMFQDGTVVDSSGQGIARGSGTSAATTQFSVRRDKGWPVGKYTVDVWLNDRPVGTRQFDIER